MKGRACVFFFFIVFPLSLTGSLCGSEISALKTKIEIRDIGIWIRASSCHLLEGASHFVNNFQVLWTHEEDVQLHLEIESSEVSTPPWWSQ